VEQWRRTVPQALFEQVRDELVRQLGGLTAYTRTPARGLWQEDGDTVYDDIIVYEVMVENLDENRWGSYRLVEQLL
jgi:hypothetical protein